MKLNPNGIVFYKSSNGGSTINLGKLFQQLILLITEAHFINEFVSHHLLSRDFISLSFKWKIQIFLPVSVLIKYDHLTP